MVSGKWDNMLLGPHSSPTLLPWCELLKYRWWVEVTFGESGPGQKGRIVTKGKMYWEKDGIRPRLLEYTMPQQTSPIDYMRVRRDTNSPTNQRHTPQHHPCSPDPCTEELVSPPPRHLGKLTSPFQPHHVLSLVTHPCTPFTLTRAPIANLRRAHSNSRQSAQV